VGNFDYWIKGFEAALSSGNLIYGFIGTFLGTLVGVLPGIGPALAIGLLLPITLKVSATQALIMFAAIYYGAMYGGSTTSILLNTPGESGSVITAVEGNKMARAGKAGAALATSAIGSFLAGTIATMLLALAAPQLADIAIKVQPAGFLALIITAFATVGTLLGSSRVRGIVALAVGLTVGLIGADLQSGSMRLTFGNENAIDGIETVTVIVALFALGEVLYLASRFKHEEWNVIPVSGRAMMNKEEWKRSWRPWLRGTAIGFPLGVIPAGGSEVPTFLSYALEKKLAKGERKAEFGNGAIEGVAGPEAANNANAAGALVPLLALGLPTSATAAVVLVAFQSYQIQPGPLLFSTNPDLVWALIASLFIGNTLLLVLNLPFIRFWIKLLYIPRPYLYAGITTFSLLGAYALNNSIFDLQCALAVGFIGYLFRRFGVPVTPMVIGVILGPLAELYYKRALQISQGDHGVLLAGPLTKSLYTFLFLIVILPPIYRVLKKKRINTAQ
jgi:putative tricarboxylic transport membrane protein